MLLAIVLLSLAAQVPALAPSELGPSVGQPLPAIAAPDQDGRMRDFVSLAGPKGLVLVFFRSADW